MKTRMLSVALLAAAMMSASMSASAESRKGDLRKDRRGDFRKEIWFTQRHCPHCKELRKMIEFRMLDPRDAMRFRMECDRRQDPRFHGQGCKFDNRDFRDGRKAHKRSMKKR